MLICELRAVYALRLCAIIVYNDLATLHHETWNDALEYASAVMQITPKFARAEGTEVFNCARQLVLEELHDNP